MSPRVGFVSPHRIIGSPGPLVTLKGPQNVPKGGFVSLFAILGSPGPLVSLKALQSVPKSGIYVPPWDIGVPRAPKAPWCPQELFRMSPKVGLTSPHRILGSPGPLVSLKGLQNVPKRWDLCHPIGYWGPQGPWCP